MLFNNNNKVIYAICVFIVLYSAVIYFKPAFLFHKDGTLRDFGLNNKQKTIVAGWTVSIFLAFVSYLIVMYSDVYIFNRTNDIYSL